MAKREDQPRRKWIRPGVFFGKTGGSVDPYRDILWTPVVLCHHVQFSSFTLSRGWVSSRVKPRHRGRPRERSGGRGGKGKLAREEIKVNLVRAVIRLIRRMEFQDPQTRWQRSGLLPRTVEDYIEREKRLIGVSIPIKIPCVLLMKPGRARKASRRRGTGASRGCVIERIII